jgi:hypothetical protein
MNIHHLEEPTPKDYCWQETPIVECRTSKCGIDLLRWMLDVERWTFLLRSWRFAVSEASGRMPDLAGESPHSYPGLPIEVVSW